MNINTSDTSTH